MKITPHDCHDMESMSRSGKSIAEISRKFEVSRSSVYRVLRLHNVRVIGDPKHKDKIGKQYGFLIIKDLVQRGKTYKWQWRAICDCANCGKKDFETSIQSIVRGSTTSCGCRRDQYEKNSRENSSQYTGYKEISGKTWSEIKRSAISRGIEWGLSIEFAWGLYERQDRKCALSGLDIIFAKSEALRHEATASLDRIDSSKGYTENNVQWVHKDVNLMKHVFSVDYYYNICRLVAEYRNDLKVLDTHDLLDARENLVGRKFRNMVTL